VYHNDNINTNSVAVNCTISAVAIALSSVRKTDKLSPHYTASSSPGHTTQQWALFTVPVWKWIRPLNMETERGRTWN